MIVDKCFLIYELLDSLFVQAFTVLGKLLEISFQTCIIEGNVQNFDDLTLRIN